MDLARRIKNLQQNEDKKDWHNSEKIYLECFLYSDIVEDNLLEKVNASISTTKRYYDEMDAKLK
ncbi:MAG: hypothetical protein ATN31_11415 [Candidatus Epulonipiscioides saccharophilum]|nr:MAG: hypothetical protein ATN31_11415 [Epulopiscium sp. AS2M-Bin001]